MEPRTTSTSTTVTPDRWPHGRRSWYGIFALVAGILLSEVAWRLQIGLAPGLILISCSIIAVMYGGWRAGAITIALGFAYFIYYHADATRSQLTMQATLTKIILLNVTLAICGFTVWWRHKIFSLMNANAQHRAEAMRQEQVAQGLRESERRLREMGDAIPQIVWTIDPAGKFQAVSRLWFEYTGAPALTGDEQADFNPYLHPADQARTHKEWESIIASGERGVLVNRILRADGEYRWHKTELMPVRGADGTLERWYATSFEVHEQRAIAESEHRFYALLDNVQDGISAFDLDWRYIYINEQFTRITERTREEVIGKTLWEMFPWVAQTNFQAEAERAIATQRTIDFEFYNPYLERWFVIHVSPTPAATLVVFSDITSRKQIEAALRRSENQFTAIFNQASIGIGQLNMSGRYVRVNRRYAELLGRTAEEMIGRTPEEFTHPEDTERTQIEISKLLEGHAPAMFEKRYIRANGSTAWVSKSLSLVHDATGRPAFVVVAVQDVTEARLALKSLKQMNEDLEQRVAERTATAEQRAAQLRLLAAELTQTEQRERRRLATVLHDHLQQLLVAARLQVGMLRRGANDERAQAAAENVDELLDQAIESSRSLTQELSPPVLYDAGLCPALEWLARWMADKQHLEVTLEIDPTAEPAAEDTRAFLFQSARELLFNVVKHSGVNRATLRLGTDAEEIVLTVQDAGRGMAQNLMQPANSDTGFGLLSLRERLQVQGGTLEITSEPGGGANVSMRLPRGEGETNGSTSRVYASTRRLGQGNGQREQLAENGRTIRILLVDDHQILRAGLASLLQDDPELRVVGEAADGQQAISMTAALEPDIVLMDVAMPGLSGIEATRRILSSQPEMRIIGLSMHEENDLAEAMRNAGACAYLPKGCPADELIATIRHHAATGIYKPAA